MGNDQGLGPEQNSTDSAAASPADLSPSHLTCAALHSWVHTRTVQYNGRPTRLPLRLLLEPRFLPAVFLLVRVRPWPPLASEKLSSFVHLGRNCMDLTQVARPANTKPGPWSYGPADDTVPGRNSLIVQFRAHGLHARLTASVASNIDPDEASISSPRGPPMPRRRLLGHP